LRSPQAYAEHIGSEHACQMAWHDARIDWLRANGVKGQLTEIRAMTNPKIAQRLLDDPDYSIGGVRRLGGPRPRDVG
jgi:hypothetical protein